MRRHFTEMWAGMDEDVKNTYGQSYMDAHVKAVEARKASGGTDIRPVLNALSDALLHPKPKSRYACPVYISLCVNRITS